MWVKSIVYMCGKDPIRKSSRLLSRCATSHWLRGKANVGYDIEGQGSCPKKEIWEISEIVFKEAIINSLSHIDYYEKGAVTTVEVFTDPLEITNPGRLVGGILAKDFGYKSFSRNPLILGYLPGCTW